MNDNDCDNNNNMPCKDGLIDNIEFGSPIIKNSLLNKIEDDTMEENELFKEMNTKHKTKEKYGSNYVSIVRPSNNLNFGFLNNLETKAEIEKILQLQEQTSPRSKQVVP